MTRFTSVSEELELLVPAFDAHGDWDDVVRRAGAPRGWRRPRTFAAVAVFAVLVALLATPAFGVQGFVLNLLGRKNVSFQKSKPAPNEIKKQFEDLSIYAPTVFAPDALAGEARVAGTLVVGGQRRALYVVPTKRGGFCYEIQEAIGGCRQTTADRKGKFGTSSMELGTPTKPGWEIVARISGDITAPGAAKLVVHYADGTTDDVPFIWVSKPIAAGFYSFDIPSAHRTVATRLRSVIVEASDGQRLGIQTFGFVHRVGVVTRPLGHPVEHVRPAPKAEPPEAPTPPLLEESAQGFRVVIGANGGVEFTQVAETRALQRLVGHNSSYGCFRLTSEFGIFTVRSDYSSGRFAPQAGLQLRHLDGSVDGCEVGTDAGHLWPDGDGSHDPAEIPFTAAGRAYFANRAAARDLALFVHTRHVQKIRHEAPAQAIRDLKAAYGKELAKSAIRIRVSDGELVFSERSTTGRAFTVVVRDGRIADENVKPFAFVF